MEWDKDEFVHRMYSRDKNGRFAPKGFSYGYGNYKVKKIRKNVETDGDMVRTMTKSQMREIKKRDKADLKKYSGDNDMLKKYSGKTNLEASETNRNKQSSEVKLSRRQKKELEAEEQREQREQHQKKYEKMLSFRDALKADSNGNRRINSLSSKEMLDEFGDLSIDEMEFIINLYT